MSREQILKEAMALPLEDRVDVAQALWGSIAETDNSAESEAATVSVAKDRDKALRDGVVAGPTHEEVMTRARRALGCE
jgi:putative addiction module component (TIGR02574 family)